MISNTELFSSHTLHYTAQRAMDMVSRGDHDVPETCAAMVWRLHSLGKKNKMGNDEKLAHSLWQLAMQLYIHYNLPVMAFHLLLASRNFTASPLLLRRISNDLDKIQSECTG